METHAIIETWPLILGCTKVLPCSEGFYVAVLDLEKCFDSVDTSQLYDILRNLVLSNNEVRGANADDGLEGACSGDVEDAAVIHKYTVTHYISSAERFVSRSVRYITEDGDIIPFQGEGNCDLI